MCKYCERRKDIRFGWEQPALYEDSKQAPFGDRLSGNMGDDWEARIHDYQTAAPELVITSKDMASYLWGNGVASLYLPVYYCPVCGRKLGRTEKAPEDPEDPGNRHVQDMLKEGAYIMYFEYQYCTETQKQHNKCIYKVMGKAQSTETGEMMAVYQEMCPPYKAFVRPVSMFRQKVDKVKYPDCIHHYQFVPFYGPLPENQEKLRLAVKMATSDINSNRLTELSDIIPDIEDRMADCTGTAFHVLQEEVARAIVSVPDEKLDHYIKHIGKRTKGDR